MWVEEVDKLQYALHVCVSVDSSSIPLYPSALPTSIPYTRPHQGVILALEIPLNDYTFQILSQNLLPDYREILGQMSYGIRL